jgi:hypothetical protein
VLPCEGSAVTSPTVLGNDLVVAALLAKPGAPIDRVIAMGERGEARLVVFDLSLLCAIASVRPHDRVDYDRFARLLQFAEIRPSLSRGPHGLTAPTKDEIAHWRSVALGD